MSARSILIFSPTVQRFGTFEVVVIGVEVRRRPTSMSAMRAVVVVEAAERLVDGAFELAEGEPERLDRALQPLEQVDRHELLQALLAAGLAEVRPRAVPPCDVVELLVLARACSGRRRPAGV